MGSSAGGGSGGSGGSAGSGNASLGDSASITDAVGKELKQNPPKQLAATAAKFGPARAKRQKVAILLSKSRKLGADIPKPPTRSKV